MIRRMSRMVGTVSAAAAAAPTFVAGATGGTAAYARGVIATGVSSSE